LGGGGKRNQTKLPVEKLVPMPLYLPKIWRRIARDLARPLGVRFLSKLYINIQFVPHREQGLIPLKGAACLLTYLLTPLSRVLLEMLIIPQ